MFARTTSNSLYDAELAISERHQMLARQIYDLQDQLDELRADHARIVHQDFSRAKLISQALAQGSTRLHALIWQKREEEQGFRNLRIVTERFFSV